MLYHCPNTRSTGVLILLEELQADCALHALNLNAREQRGAAYLAINPMGKVPAVLHGAALVTEQAAIHLYLADSYPEAGLTPDLICAGWCTTHRVSSQPWSTGPRSVSRHQSA